VIPFFERQDEGRSDPANPFAPKPYVVRRLCLPRAMLDAVQWFYQVLIENQGAMPVQLVSRLWHMKDGQGNLDKICGPGVVGVMPVLSQGTSTSFQYVSAITMSTPTGIMGYVCCAVLCCAVLCCAVLCCAVLCCAVLCCAVLCCVVSRASPYPLQWLLHLCRAAVLGRARPHH
jgi:hypothetical protein